MNTALRDRLEGAARDVERGRSLHTAANRYGLFPEALSVYVEASAAPLVPVRPAGRDRAPLRLIVLLLLIPLLWAFLFHTATAFAVLQVVLFVGAGVWGAINSSPSK
jgi:hypothetical protein